MPLEVFLWVASILIPFGVGWSIAILIVLRNVKKTGDDLMTMHRNANGFGFGTVGLSDSFKEARETQKDLIHYLKWFVEKTTGEEPPPPLREN